VEELPIEMAERGKQWAKKYHTEMNKRKAEKVINGPGSRYEANPWLEMTGWVEHLAGIKKRKVTKVIQPTEMEMTDEERVVVGNLRRVRERRQNRSHLMIEEQEDEDEMEGRKQDEEFGNLDDEEVEERDEGLYEASVTIGHLIREAFGICEQKKIGNAVLEYIDRPEFGGRKDWRPFYAKQKVVTIKKYTEVWVKILRYIWRTADVEEGERPRYRFTDKQREMFEEWRELARDALTNKEWKEAMIDRACQFWLAMFDQHIHSDHHKSGVLSGVAVLGLNTEEGS